MFKVCNFAIQIKEMAYILNLETATKNCSVSIANGGKVLAVREIATENFSHAEKLHVFIEECLQEANLTFQNINAVAVSKGPGSYTGLRIGVSAAKGFCYALNIPLISVDTLELLAKKVTIENGIIVPMIDARRMEVYTAFFGNDYTKISETEAKVIDENSFFEVQVPMHLVGDGAIKLKSVLTDTKFNFYDEILYPSALEMCQLSFDKFKISDFEDVAYFEPFYLKDFVLNK